MPFLSRRENPLTSRPHAIEAWPATTRWRGFAEVSGPSYTRAWPDQTNVVRSIPLTPASRRLTPLLSPFYPSAFRFFPSPPYRGYIAGIFWERNRR